MKKFTIEVVNNGYILRYDDTTKVYSATKEFNLLKDLSQEAFGIRVKVIDELGADR